MKSRSTLALCAGLWACALPFSSSLQAASVAVAEFPISAVPVPKLDFSSPYVDWVSSTEFVVVWQRPSEHGADLMLRRFNQNGVPLAAEVRLVTSNAFFSERSATVKRVDNGHFAVIWSDHDDVSTEAASLSWDLYGQVFDFEGNATSTRFPVDYPVNGAQVFPALVALTKGRFAVVYRTDHVTPGDADIAVQRFTLSGRPTGNVPVIVNTTTAGLDTRPAVGCNATTCLVTWTHYDSLNGSTAGVIKGQYLTPDGILDGTEFTVSTATADPKGATFSQIAMASNGPTTVTWATGNPAKQAYFTRYRADRSVAKAGVALNAASNYLESPSVPAQAEISGRPFAIAWADDTATQSRVLVRDFTSGGATVGTLKVNATSTSAYYVYVTSAAISPEGRMAVLWTKYPVDSGITTETLHGSVVTNIGVAPVTAKAEVE